MKKKINLVRRLLSVSLVVCLVLAGANVVVTANGEQNADINGGFSINSSYLASGSITFQATSGTQKVIVTTRAFLIAQNIYHHITVYKISGGVQSLVHDKTYYDYNTSILTTNLPFSASYGDQFIVYADHYTNHNGLVETVHTEKTTYFLN